VPSSHHVSTALLVCIPHVLTFSRSLTLQSLLCSSSKAVTGYRQFGPHHAYRKYTETAHVLCSETPIRQPSLEISPLWFPLIGKEINCYLGQVSRFYHVMCFVLVLTSTHSVCWSFKLFTILVIIDSFYILLELVHMTCRPILYFFHFIIIVRLLRVCVSGIYNFRCIGCRFSRVIYGDVSVISC